MIAPRFVDLSDLAAVDGHCHPLLGDPWGITPEAFLDFFTEGRPGAMGAHVSHTGYYRRAIRALAERLGAEPTVEALLDLRRSRGLEVARGWLNESRVTAMLVDTGYPPGAMALDEMRKVMPCAIHEVFRIETCAQRLLVEDLAYDGFIEAFRKELGAAAQRSIALKSIIAYRSGLAVERWPREDVISSYGRVRTRARAGEPVRLVEKPLLDGLFEVALDVSKETGRPLQVHSGFGDPDIDLLQANPLLLRPILEDPRWAGVRIVLLHLSYPYFREGAFMASIWPQVHLDLSLALPFLGPGAIPPLIEALSLAPASKLLYGSDVGGLPELFALSADWARALLGEALSWIAEREGMASEEARGIGRLILTENARALYGL